ncbi:pyridoxamine 5'-phosphate oxidase family protein [Glaciecola sp.]|jgi:pyridoxamine 5'-phosphate oxidase|uniref:pyridoxamine 5'-phosphate oxidase family protein n=1 Tax=Glaciecola sp. MF2-115 TaxID=3384827 RepID=UPI003989A711
MSKLQAPDWKIRLDKSLNSNKGQSHSKFYQVASVTADGMPKNRTMVFRGFLANSEKFVSVTDIRSDKIKEWESSSSQKFEICWYFVESREQYRISGHVQILSSDSVISHIESADNKQSKSEAASLIREQWNKLSKAAKEQFYCAEPKAPFDDELDIQPSELQDGNLENVHGVSNNEGNATNCGYTNETSKESQISKTENNSRADKALDISENFCVVIFIPTSVDYLNLLAEPHYRSISKQENNWLESRVNA